MITDTITGQIGAALKANDKLRLSVLRMLSSALNYEKISKQHELSEQEEIAVVRRESKKRNDAIESLRLAQDKPTAHTKEEIDEKIEAEQAELAILKEYLPAEMDETELQKMVDEAVIATGASTIADMGKVIGVVMGKAAGRVEGGKVSQLVKSRLA